jgi:hypothetical protein
MVTSIVRAIRKRLAEGGEHGVEVEIIFPVAAEAVATTQDQLLPIIPGVSGGEGCSTAGGCATCPFMKMNSIDALCDLLERLPVRGSSEAEVIAARQELSGFEPEKVHERLVGIGEATYPVEGVGEVIDRRERRVEQLRLGRTLLGLRSKTFFRSDFFGYVVAFAEDARNVAVRIHQGLIHEVEETPLGLAAFGSIQGKGQPASCERLARAVHLVQDVDESGLHRFRHGVARSQADEVP